LFLRGKSEVIYNGIDPAFFDPEQAIDRGIALRERLGISKDAKVACCIARFQPEKGHLILLNAFKQVLSHLQNGYLILAGDGILRAELEKCVQELGLADNVRFLGSVGDVRPVLAASDVSVIASTAVETFSIAMLESMSMKVPVVGTDIGGMSEAVIHGVTGFVVPVGDKDALAQTMLLALSNDEMRHSMGAAARNLVERSFTRAEMIEQTERVIEKII
jgi:glycosyltransferase involved in cell wall biosynthesis